MLKVKKGGLLFKTDWVYDDEKEEGSYVDTEVSKHFLRHLWDSCELEEGVTIRDIAKLLSNIDSVLLSVVFSDWIEEYVELILQSKKSIPDYARCVELYWWFDKSEEDVHYGSGFPSCHIIGNPQTKAEYYCDGSDSTEIIKDPAYGVSGEMADEYADLPIELREKVDFYSSGFGKNCKVEYSTKLDYSLGHIIKSIFWELSFHGSPKQAEIFTKDIKEQVVGVSKIMKDKS